jgi:hypothetical protein
MVEEKSNPAQGYVERTLATPANDTPNEVFNQVSIIKGLSIDNDLMKIELRLRGYKYDMFKNCWIQVRRPVMNELGIGNFIAVLQGVGDIVNFSYYNEKDIPKFAFSFFSDNFPQFLIYHKEFDLKPEDFNIIKTILKFWALSVLNNSKNAGHRNVVRGTLSEGILARALGNNSPEEKKKGGLFSFLRRNKKE